MLGKLMKYDLRSGIRRFAIVWIGLAALAAINGFTLRFLNEGRSESDLLSFFVGVLPLILLFAMYVAMGILVLVFVVDRFYKGLLGDEGYLMFTLPVTSSAHIASKTLSALIFEILSALVALVSGVLLMAVFLPAEGIRELSDMIRALAEELRANPLPAGTGWVIAEFVLYSILTAAVANLQIYTALSLGHLAKKNRGAFSLLAYVGISIALSMIMSSCMTMLFQSDAFSGVLAGNWQFSVDGTGWHVQGVNLSASALGAGIALELIKGTGFFFATRAILNKRLNLE